MQLAFRYLGNCATNLFLLTAGVRELWLLADILWQFVGTETNCNWLKPVHSQVSYVFNSFETLVHMHFYVLVSQDSF